MKLKFKCYIYASVLCASYVWVMSNDRPSYWHSKHMHW
jgi:hypothetical protein